MAEKVKVIHVPVSTHGDLAELVGRKKKAQLQTSMQHEVNRALVKHIRIETTKLAS